MANYEKIQQRIAKLQDAAMQARNKEVDRFIAQTRKQMKIYGLTADDLRGAPTPTSTMANEASPGDGRASKKAGKAAREGDRSPEVPAGAQQAERRPDTAGNPADGKRRSGKTATTSDFQPAVPSKP